MSVYRIQALAYGIFGLALMIVGVILNIKNNSAGIWSYVVGMFFVSKTDNLLVWDHVTKKGL